MADCGFSSGADNGVNLFDVRGCEYEVPVVVTVHIKSHVYCFRSAIFLSHIWPTWIIQAV